MRASLYKITTDHEGASRIIFDVPSSDLANVVMLLPMLQKELELTAVPAKSPEPVVQNPVEVEPIL